MMYVEICLSITDQTKPRKNYFIYKTELTDLMRGDVVLLENADGPKTGVFVRYLEKDFNPHGLKRVNVIEKVDSSVLEAHLRCRYEEFKNFKLSNRRPTSEKLFNEIKQLFRSNRKNFLYWKVMRIICFGNRIDSKDRSAVQFYYKNKRVFLTLKDGEWVLKEIEYIKKDVKWVRSEQSHHILVELFKQDKNSRSIL